MSIDALNWAWRQKDLSCGQKLVLLALADRADETHFCWPSVARLVQDTGLTDRSIFRVLKELEARGLIVRHHNEGGRTHYALIGVTGRENAPEKNEASTDASVTPDIMSPLTQCHPSPDIMSGGPLTFSTVVSNKKNPKSNPKGTQRERRAPAKPQKEIFGEFGNVKLTPEEFARLNAEHGEKDTADAIALLDLHIGAAKQGDTYRSHYLAMKKWVFNAVEERRAKQARASPGQPAAPTEWQLQRQRQRLMAADLNRRRVEEEREWANWTGWDKPTKSRDDDGIAIFSGTAIGENEHVVSGGH